MSINTIEFNSILILIEDEEEEWTKRKITGVYININFKTSKSVLFLMKTYIYSKFTI